MELFQQRKKDESPYINGDATPISHATTQVDLHNNNGKDNNITSDMEKNPDSFPSSSSNSVKEGEVRMLKWTADDPLHPFNWPLSKRWMYALIAFTFNACTAFNATGYNPAQGTGSEEFNVTRTVWLTGTTCYIVPVAITPLVLAPLSEHYGRRPLYCIALFLFTMMYIPQALAPNMATILATRVIQGMAGSVGNTMVAGTVADIFPKKTRAIPMGAFVMTVFIAQSIGSVASSWTANTVGWRWIFWWQGAAALTSFSLVTLFLPETREWVLLAKRAKQLSQQHGLRYVTGHEDSPQESFIRVAARNASRPVLFFVTEPIVTFMSLWIGFLWGTVFLSLNGVSHTFRVYGWTISQRESVLSTIGIGAILGFLTNLHQAHLYNVASNKANGKPAPEARLYWSMPAAVFTVAGLLWYGWAAADHVHPVVPILGLIVFSWGVYIIYLSTLAYIADSYETYASSGIACQALLRNTFAGTFVLFAHPMYNHLTPKFATTLLACIAAALGTAPFILFVYGEKLRSKSRVYKILRREEEERERNG